jgi:UbiD family decarboxylase
MLDLRVWLKKLEEMGSVKTVKGMHWDLEVGVATRARTPHGRGRMVESDRAFLFDDIVGYPSGYRILTNTGATPRLSAMTLFMPPTDSAKELTQALRKKLLVWEATQADFEPKTVSSGPILENVDRGRDVDLLKFPIPKWHPLDAGRFIGPGDAVITRDPDTGEINIGTYRCQIHDARTTGLWISPGHHGRLHREKYHARGQACPVAISIGHHPIVFTIASTHVPFGAEYNLIGAISGEPVKVIKEEVTGLPIPAQSEIVIVGWCPPDKKRLEGPFGEGGAGDYYHPAEQQFIVEVERIYYRNSPIIHGGVSGIVGLGGASLLNHLERCGVPDVKAVWISEGGKLVVVSIKQRYGGHARQAALVASQAPAGGVYHGRYVIVVDDDIDPSNVKDVLWAMCTRSNPEVDIDIIRRAWSTPLDVTIHKPTRDFTNSRAIIDACKPFEWIDEFPKVITWDQELVERVKKKLQ